MCGMCVWGKKTQMHGLHKTQEDWTWVKRRWWWPRLPPPTGFKWDILKYSKWGRTMNRSLVVDNGVEVWLEPPCDELQQNNRNSVLILDVDQVHSRRNIPCNPYKSLRDKTSYLVYSVRVWLIYAIPSSYLVPSCWMQHCYVAGYAVVQGMVTLKPLIKIDDWKVISMVEVAYSWSWSVLC